MGKRSEGDMNNINHRGIDMIARSLGVRSLKEALEAQEVEQREAVDQKGGVSMSRTKDIPAKSFWPTE